MTGPLTSETRPALERLATALVCLLALVSLALIVWAPDQYFGDFKIYYSAAQAARHGLNPYVHGNLTLLPGQAPNLPFINPPLILGLFAPLAWLPYRASFLLWYVVNLAALAGLFRLWSRHFLHLRLVWTTVLFFLLAFNSCLYVSLYSGNVATLEQLGLWLAFAFLLRRRDTAFGLCLALVAQVKTFPLLFLALLLVRDGRPRWGPFLGSLALFAALFSLNFVLSPGLFPSFAAAAVGQDPRGVDNNQSTLALIRDCVDYLAFLVPGVPRALSLPVYLLCAAGVVFGSVRAWRRYLAAVAVPDGCLFVFFFCTVYAVIAPRLITYSYAILLLPALSLLRRRPAWPVAPLAAVFAFAALHPSVPVFSELTLLLLPYLALVAGYALWYAYLREIRLAADPGAAGDSVGERASVIPQ